jgi:hypothetical protein
MQTDRQTGLIQQAPFCKRTVAIASENAALYNVNKRTRIYLINNSLRVNSSKGLEELHASKKPVI